MEFRNGKSGEIINTNYTKAEILAKFGETADDNNWLWFWLAQHAERQRTACPLMVDMKAFLADSFLLAVGMGLKRPMIRLHTEGRRYKIYLSARGTICIKSGALIPGTSNPAGDEVYMGCLTHGKFLKNDRRTLLEVEQKFIDNISADPAGFMAQASKDMDRCCYCNQPLEDARSKQVGYGGTCAEKWGLPWGKTYDEKVPSFAEMWRDANQQDKRNVRAICAELRKNPFDELSWAALGDVMEEKGYKKRPTAPERTVTIPQAA